MISLGAGATRCRTVTLPPAQARSLCQSRPLRDPLSRLCNHVCVIVRLCLVLRVYVMVRRAHRHWTWYAPLSCFSQPSSFSRERSYPHLIPIRGFARPIYLLLFLTTLTTEEAMWIVHEIAFFASVAYYIIISRIPSLSIYKVQKVRPLYTSLFSRQSSETRSLTTHDGHRRIVTLLVICGRWQGDWSSITS